MSYTKEDVLALSDKTEEEQYRWLSYHEILAWKRHYTSLLQVNPQDSYNSDPINWMVASTETRESLADCAFRLRDELLKEYETPKGWVWSDCYRPIAHIIAPNNTCTHCGHDDRYFDWDAEAKPIHWIQAALLAKIERGE